MAEHVFDASVYHHAWDRDLEPALAVAPGDVVHFDLLMAGDRQVQEGAAFEDCAFDFDTLYNLAGPVHVEGAKPGDTLSVEILSLETGDWGWCVILPELGLLPEDFPEGFVRTFDLRGGSTTTLVPGVEIPIVPFCGTMGNCPDREGPVRSRSRRTRAPATSTHATSPPARPSTSPSTCPARASRSAIRTPHRATARSAWPRSSARCARACASTSCAASSPGPWFVTPPGPLTPRVDAGGFYGTMGIADDLMEGSRIAVRNMVALLGERHGLEPRDAYMLCSLAGDLKILEIVDAGMWNVGMLVPRSVFV